MITSIQVLKSDKFREAVMPDIIARLAKVYGVTEIEVMIAYTNQVPNVVKRVHGLLAEVAEQLAKQMNEQAA